MAQEKEAFGGENPAQPAGWAVPPGSEEQVRGYAPGELEGIEEQKRRDTATWEDANNANPVANEGQNPAQPPGPYVPEYTQVAGAKQVIARVFVAEEADSVRGGKVLLRDSDNQVSHIGRVIAAVGKEFWVKWADGDSSIEKKEEYELIRTVEDEE